MCEICRCLKQTSIHQFFHPAVRNIANVGTAAIYLISFLLVNLKTHSSEATGCKLHEQRQTYVAQSDNAYAGAFLRNKLNNLFFDHRFRFPTNVALYSFNLIGLESVVSGRACLGVDIVYKEARLLERCAQCQAGFSLDTATF